MDSNPEGPTMSSTHDPPPRDYRSSVPIPLDITMVPIGFVRSPHTERHGTPRQPGIPGRGRESAMEPSRIELDSQRIPHLALRDLDGFERIWVISYLHLNPNWGPLVRPPRGNRKRGVLSTRSPHHPNPIGLSAVLLERIEGTSIHVRGLDLIDGTPVLDVKPYIPYCDAFTDSAAGWVDELSDTP